MGCSPLSIQKCQLTNVNLCDSSSDLIILGEEVDITEKTTEEVKTTPEDILHEIEIDSTSNTPELIRRPIFDYDGYFTVEVTVSGITLPPNRPEHRLLYVALFPPDIRLRDHQLILMDNRTDTEERHHLHVRVYSGAWLRLEVAFHIHPRYASFKLYPESFVIRDSMSVRDITSHLFIVYADHWELSLTIKCIEDCQSESNEYGSDYGHLGSGDDFEHDYK